ncbi:helix-turn-helix domain-containing protein [uncultured Fusobacterium sp.]|jgi:transcriptional regulator with XRE-family HTH domain|uniref:helix-turn-helix domain-containing protein n=1 Tax=uncultured Fusobacterium sp. TaxID=159267 RepID=UPI0015A66F57|nr:helix-turn-helix domain-containing protein [uncultured Fusobacterium sp.]
MEKKFNYGDRLKELRKPTGDKNAKKSMEELCEIFANEYGLNVNKSMISRWENGTAMPDNKHVIAYSKYFDVDINYLLGVTNIKRRMSDNQIGESVEKEVILNRVLENLKKLDKEKLEQIEVILEKLEKLDMDTLKAYTRIIK